MTETIINVPLFFVEQIRGFKYVVRIFLARHGD